MTSEKQIAANRRNALQSTGPKTPEGKDRVRSNARRQDRRALNQDPAGLDQLRAELEAEWQPRTLSERLLVEQMVDSQRQQVRLLTAQAQLLIKDPSGLKHLVALDRLSVKQSHFEEAGFRAYQQLDEIKRRRAN